MLQAFQPRERSLGHGLDLVAEQRPAVSKHPETGGQGRRVTREVGGERTQRQGDVS